jgi:hypothetical protein
VTRQVLEQLSPAPDESVEPRGGTSLFFVRSYTGTSVLGVRASVSAVGAPAEDVRQIARGIVHEFGEALDRLAE